MQPRDTDTIHKIENMVAYRSKDGTVKPAKVVNYNRRANTYTVRNVNDGRVVAVQSAFCYSQEDVESLCDESTYSGIEEANEYLKALGSEKYDISEFEHRKEVPEEPSERHDGPKTRDWRNVAVVASVFSALLFGMVAINASHESSESLKKATEAARTKTKAEIVASQVNALNIEKAKFSGSCKQIETIDAEIQRLLKSVNNFR